MKDTRKTKAQLIAELDQLRQRVAQLDAAATTTTAEAPERAKAEKIDGGRKDELAIQNRISTIFLTVPDDALYGEVLAVILEAMESEHGVFGYIDEEGNWVCPSMTRDVWDECRMPDKTPMFAPEQWGGLWGQALVEKRSVLSNGPLRPPEGHVPVGKALASPILYRGQLIGLLVVGNKPSDYTEQDRRRLEGIADRVAPILFARLERERLEREQVDAQRRLAELEAFYRSILGNIRTGVMVIDKHDCMHFSNTAMADITGVPQDEYAGLRVLRDFPQDEERVGLYLQAKETLRPQRFGPISVVTHVGKRTYQSGWLLPQVRDGRYVGMIVTVEDDTERAHAQEALRKAHDELEMRVAQRTAELAQANEVLRKEFSQRQKAEAALRESEERLRLLVENADDLLFLQDLDRRYVYARIPPAYGMTAEDFVGRKIEDMAYLFGAEKMAAILKRFEHVATTGKSVAKEDKARMHGRDYWLHAVTYPIRAASGELTGIGTIARDITKLKRAQEALRESEQSYRTLAENLPGIVYRVHLREDRVEFFNDMVRQLTGYTKDEFTSRGTPFFRSLILEQDRERAVRTFRTAIEYCSPYEVEYRLRRKSGKMAHLIERGRVRPGPDGAGTYMDGIIVDLTEHIRAQALLMEASRIEATTTLAGGIAHDFNNLMVGVLGNAELLIDDFADQPKTLELLKDISQAATRAGQLAQQMIAFTHGGKHEPRAIDLNSIVQETVRLQEPSVPEGIEIVQDLEPCLQDTHADPVQIGQVAMNLCLNAVEAIEGCGRVIVTTRNLAVDDHFVERHRRFAPAHVPAEPGLYVCLAVSDTGCGMSDDVVSRAFEPFFSTKFQGRGLGLASAYGIVRNHGGHVWLDTAEGEGTTVTIILPAIEPSAGDAQAKQPG